MKKIILLLLIFFVSCSSLEEQKNVKALEYINQGNYVEAAYLLQEAISLNPEFLDGMVNYRNIYPYALEEVEDKITSYNENKNYKLESSSYENLIKLENGLYTLDKRVHEKLGLSLEIPTSEDIDDTNKKAGIAYYNRGRELEGKDLDRYEQREKYQIYKRSLELNNGYEDVLKKYNDSYEEAKLLIAFDIDNNSEEKDNIVNVIKNKVKSEMLNSDLKELLIFKDLEEKELKEYYNNAGNLSLKKLEEVKNYIKITVDYVAYTPVQKEEELYKKSWEEEYYVTVNGEQIKRYITRYYIEKTVKQSNGLELGVTYQMIDLSTGMTLGSKSIVVNTGDYQNYKTFVSGNIPKDLSYTQGKTLKTKSTLLNEALVEAGDILGVEVIENI